MIIIPFDPTAGNQKFSVPLDGERYTMTFRFNQRDSAWFFSLVHEDGTRIVDGRRVVGVGSLLPTTRLDRQPPGFLGTFNNEKLGTHPGRFALGTDRAVEVVYIPESDLP